MIYALSQVSLSVIIKLGGKNPLSFWTASPIGSLVQRRFNMKNKLVEFLKDESGQTSTEYILLVAVVAVVIYKFKGVLQTRLESLVGNVFDKGDDILKDIN